MIIKKNKELLRNARILRKNMTPQERKLWYCFLRTYPIKIYKQRIIDSFIVDFYCAKAKLVIEIDGSQHYTDVGIQYDIARSGILENYGLQIIRFSNYDIDTNFNNICLEIDRIIQSRRLIK